MAPLILTVIHNFQIPSNSTYTLNSPVVVYVPKVFSYLTLLKGVTAQDVPYKNRLYI
jgi:hypothetical protein